MRAADLAFQRDKYKHLSDAEWRWMLQQVEGRERTADKLPTFASIEDWWYPVRLSCEQCSSELTARYKALLVQGTCSNGKCLDLTGGYGVQISENAADVTLDGTANGKDITILRRYFAGGYGITLN